jgi:hypothetical protein
MDRLDPEAAVAFGEGGDDLQPGGDDLGADPVSRRCGGCSWVFPVWLRASVFS